MWLKFWINLNFRNTFDSKNEFNFPILEKQRKFKKNPVLGLEKLTDRERQILDELIKGYTADKVASHFGLSPHTVRTQIRSIYSKLKVNNRTNLINKLRLND